MLLNSPIILSRNSFKIHLLFSKLFPYSHNYSHKKQPFLIKPMQTYYVIKHKKLYLVTNKKHKKLLTARDFFNCSHRYAKCLIVGLSLYKSNCRMAWETKQQPWF